MGHAHRAAAPHVFRVPGAEFTAVIAGEQLTTVREI
jgi:hypothetical protein